MPKTIVFNYIVQVTRVIPETLTLDEERAAIEKALFPPGLTAVPRDEDCQVTKIKLKSSVISAE